MNLIKLKVTLLYYEREIHAFVFTTIISAITVCCFFWIENKENEYFVEVLASANMKVKVEIIDVKEMWDYPALDGGNLILTGIEVKYSFTYQSKKNNNKIYMPLTRFNRELIEKIRTGSEKIYVCFNSFDLEKQALITE